MMEWLADRGKEASAKAAHLAAEKGSRHALRALAEQCGDKVLTAPRVDGSTPAHGAALNGKVDVLRFLGERCGREVWMAAAANGDTPAHCAAQEGHVSVLRFLCEAGDETALTTANAGGLSPARHAAVCGQVEALRFLADECGSWVLMDGGADGSTPAHLAARNGRVNVLLFLPEQRKHVRLRSRSPCLAHCLVAKIGCQVLAAADAKGSTPAHCAAFGGHVEVLRLLADLCGKQVLTAVEADGHTPAHRAASTGQVGALRFLGQQCGEKVMTAARAGGSTPLHDAASNGQMAAIRLLTEQCGRDVITAADSKGDTPAHCAASKGHINVLGFLAELRGSDVLTSPSVVGNAATTALHRLEQHSEHQSLARAWQALLSSQTPSELSTPDKLEAAIAAARKVRVPDGEVKRAEAVLRGATLNSRPVREALQGWLSKALGPEMKDLVFNLFKAYAQTVKHDNLLSHAQQIPWCAEMFTPALVQIIGPLAVLVPMLIKLVNEAKKEKMRQEKAGAALAIDDNGQAAALSEYRILLSAVLVDGEVSKEERVMVREYACKKAISVKAHNAMLLELGWTTEQWDRGTKT